MLLIKLEYVSIFLVITEISLYLNFLSLTSLVICFATFSISEYWFLAKNNLIFSTFLSYFFALLLKIFFSKYFNSSVLKRGVSPKYTVFSNFNFSSLTKFIILEIVTLFG